MSLTIISEGYKYRRLRYSPFELTKTPFGKQVWCQYCQLDVDPELSKGFYMGIDVARMRCLRCGKVLGYGLDQRLLRSQDPSILEAAKTFILQTGDDRS